MTEGTMNSTFKAAELKVVRAMNGRGYRIGFESPISSENESPPQTANGAGGGGDTTVLVELVARSGPICVLPPRHDCKNMEFVSVEAGGGGDCFFHSVAYLLNHSGRVRDATYADVRRMASDFVNAGNVDLLLMDMAGVYVARSDGEMEADPKRPPVPPGVFNPLAHWNATRDDREARILGMKDAISRQGNYLWGNENIASVLEIVLGINIVCISEKSGGKFVGSRSYLGYMRDLGIHGSIPKERGDRLDLSRETIVIMNHGNMHWTAICVLCKTETEEGGAFEMRRYFVVPPDQNLGLLDLML